MCFKIVITLLVVLSCQVVKSQNDSLKILYQHHPLVRAVDSISRQLKGTGRSVELALGTFGRPGTFRRAEYSGVIIWKDGATFRGMSIHEDKNGPKGTEIVPRRIKHIALSRLLSDSCDLCELLNGQKRARIDHPLPMYLKRGDRFACNEVYFYDVSYLDYDSNSCAYGLRQIISLW